LDLRGNFAEENMRRNRGKRCERKGTEEREGMGELPPSPK